MKCAATVFFVLSSQQRHPVDIKTPPPQKLLQSRPCRCGETSVGVKLSGCSLTPLDGVFFISLGSRFSDTKLSASLQEKVGGIVTASTAASAPLSRHLFLSPLFSCSISRFTPLQPVWLHFCMQVRVLNSCPETLFPHSPTQCVSEADQTCHTLSLSPPLTPPAPFLTSSENMRYGGTLQTLPSGPSDNPPTKPQPRNTGSLDIAQPVRNNENKSRIHGLLSLFCLPTTHPPLHLHPTLFLLFRFLLTFASAFFSGLQRTVDRRQCRKGGTGEMIESRRAEIFHCQHQGPSLWFANSHFVQYLYTDLKVINWG